jgi:hypothetical protein
MIKKSLAAFAAITLLLIPSVSFASSLTQPQVNAIIGILIAFGVDQQTIVSVKADLAGSAPETSINQSPAVIIPASSSVQTTYPLRINPVALASYWHSLPSMSTSTSPGFVLSGTGINLYADGLFVGTASQMPENTSQVDYQIDGQDLGHPTLRPGCTLPCSIGDGDFIMPIDTTKYANGDHTLTITAVDPSTGNQAIASMTIAIQN